MIELIATALFFGVTAYCIGFYFGRVSLANELTRPISMWDEPAKRPHEIGDANYYVVPCKTWYALPAANYHHMMNNMSSNMNPISPPKCAEKTS